MTDRIRTADETTTQRPQIPVAAETARISLAWRETARLRQERDDVRDQLAAAQRELADLRAQLGAAQDALAAIRHGVEHIDRALAGHDTQQPTAPDPAEQLVTAHRAGYDQAVANLRDRNRFIAWQMSDSPRDGGTLLADFADYLADTYETPA